MLNKPYLKKLESIEDFAVWEVDGKYIRDNINREFTNFGQHFRFPFIPKNEFWLDKEHGTKESKYYIDHLLTEWNLMHSGFSYDDAITKADALEQRERLKTNFLSKVEQEVDSIFGIVPSEVYVKKLIQLADLTVCIVNGSIVREDYFIDFTEGGHHFVYNFVPLNEVWLDDDLAVDEREFVLLHELHERYLMANGKDYDSAHRSSSIIEYKCRRGELDLKKAINDEVTKNTSLTKS